MSDLQATLSPSLFRQKIGRAPTAADALRMTLEPPAPLILGIDPGGKDWTAVSITQRMTDGAMKLLEMEIVDPLKTNLDRLINKLHRDISRPQGYSHSHWRKLWKHVHG